MGIVRQKRRARLPARGNAGARDDVAGFVILRLYTWKDKAARAGE